MKVLLTGAGGFLGRRVGKSLLSQGVAQLRMQYRTVKPPSAVEIGVDSLRVQYSESNLLSRGALEPLVNGVDCIVHAAAGMRGAPADMFANTVVATRNLLEAAREANVRRFVLVSSFAVYRTSELRRGQVLDEACHLEPNGVNKGTYGFVKTRQEQLVAAYTYRHGMECVLLRPGVIYGPGSAAISPRVGLRVFGLFFSLGGTATLPLTYVDNCADAVAIAALRASHGSVLNIVDDDLPSCRNFLRQYRKNVEPLKVVPVPYCALLLAAGLMKSYSDRSHGQLPAILTPYMVRSMYRPLRYSNAALKQLGWTMRVPTSTALRLTMSAFADDNT